MEMTDVQTRLAGATVKRLRYPERGPAFDYGGEADKDGNPLYEQVYVFGNELRAPCPKDIHNLIQGDEGCVCCQGRGWTATADGWAWIDAAMALGLGFAFPGGAQVGFFATVLREVEKIPGVELHE